MERRVIATDPAYPSWNLERLVLKTGDIVYRIASGEPGQVGIFGFDRLGALYYAPISDKVMVPGNVWASAERAVRSNYKEGPK